MRRVYNATYAILMVACWTATAVAQPASQTTTAVPRLVNFSGTLTDGGGKPLTGVVGVTFALYQEQEGGAPVWTETQNVQAAANGDYTALLGATRNEGIPAEVFGSGQRWLSVQAQGQAEGARTLMTSVPYSLKAVDAETLGGLPASAFALAGTSAGTTAGTAGNGALGASIASPRAVEVSDAAKPAANPAAVTGTGTTGTVPLWTSSTALGNSAILQGSTGNVGVPRVSPNARFLADNPSGIGIAGVSTSSTGTSGIGVQGEDQQTTGTTTGVVGLVASDAGTGVNGQATATTGATIGVGGLSTSDAGVGVAGQANATTGTTTGVFGTVASDAGTGVWGAATADSGETYGVFGEDASSAGIGVEGNASATTGGTTGVYGTAASDSGYGVWGNSTATSGTTIGVYGQDASDTGYGVEGQATAASGLTVGVYGKSLSDAGTGVEGNATAGSGFTIGVNGTAASTEGFGVEGYASATSGDTVGVVGRSASSSGVGVQGYGLTLSALGADMAGTPAGVWGDSNGGEAAVLATADDAYAFKGYNNSGSESTLYIENQTTSPTATVLAAQGSGGSCYIFTDGDLDCTGSVGGGATVNVGAGAPRDVALYAVQAPENWFEDMGSGQLHNGAAVVALEAEYAQTVNTAMEYHVFLTPKGDCKGLYVTNETAASFEVHELGGGSSSIAFDYKIEARRKGYESIRMADLSGKMQMQRNLKSGSGGRLARAAARQPRVLTPPADAARAAHVAKPHAQAAQAPHAAKPLHSSVLSQTPAPR